VRVALVLLASVANGCLYADEEVIKRAAHEVPCDPSRIHATPRPELSEATYDVEACGHLLRYTCSKPMGRPLTCAREPNPTPR
jgi:hypothetical protein